jgi:hypothetical protein
MMRNLVVAALALGFGLGVNGASFPDARVSMTTVMINQPVRVQGTLLSAGAYQFRRMVWTSNREVVRIFDQGGHLITTKLARPAYRDVPTDSATFTFGESIRSNPPALKTWFPGGEHYGLKFSE